jgi:hypothetical protein
MPPAPEKVLTTGVPLNVPEAHAAVPHVKAPVKIDVAVPPVIIGVTVGAPAFAQHPTLVIVQSAPQLFGHATGESLSSASGVEAAPGSPILTTHVFTLCAGVAATVIVPLPFVTAIPEPAVRVPVSNVDPVVFPIKS